MRKCVLLILFLGLLVPGGVQAQSVWNKVFWKKSSSALKQESAGGRIIAPKKASKTLARRRAATFNKAKHVQKSDMANCMMYGEYPIKKISGWPFWFSNEGPYEDNALVQQLSRAAKKDYFIAAHNRAIARATDIRRQALRQMKENEKALTSRFYSPAPSKAPASDVASLVKDNQKYIFLGEVHFFPKIQQEIERTLLELRKKYPERKIFFLTEFLPNTETRAYRNKMNKYKRFSDYASIIRVADVLNMPVIGLDPIWLFNEKYPLMWVSKQNGLVEKEEMWHSVEVIRLRNQIWKQKVLALRELYPDALFVFHTGSSHVEYNAPFSLSAEFAPEETFVATFYPYQVTDNKPERSDLLDAFNSGLFAWRRFVAWPDAEMARVAGFNVRFKIPAL